MCTDYFPELKYHNNCVVRVKALRVDVMFLVYKMWPLYNFERMMQREVYLAPTDLFISNIRDSQSTVY